MNHEILIIDIESTCWKDNSNTPDGQKSEIIEIGHAILNCQTLDISYAGSIFIKPTCSSVSDFCSNLTHITNEQLEQHGVTFPEACLILEKNLRAGQLHWASFGNYDVRMFKEQCLERGVKYPFTPQHLNIKALAATLTGKVSGLGSTLTRFKLQFEGTQHSGKDDAYNIARLLKEIIRRHREYQH